MFPSHIRIVIVDDSESSLIRIKGSLNELGYKNVIEFTNGNDAYSYLAECAENNQDVDLIICDWNMPEMTGLELLSELRETREYSNVPFIMLTAENEMDSVLKAIQLKVSHYIVKPVTADTLSQKLMTTWQKMMDGE